MKPKDLAIAALIVIVAVGFFVNEQWTTMRIERLSREQSDLIEVTADRALVGDRDLHVVVAVKLRNTAGVSELEFVHVRGYFIDQNGTSYSPRVTEVGSDLLPGLASIDRTDTHLLRRGEVYRYAFGPAYTLGPMTAGRTGPEITRITLYLDGYPPVDVPLEKWKSPY